MDYKGQSAVAAVAIATLVFLIVMVVTQNVVDAMNLNVFSDGVANLLDIIPLVLVGGAIVAIIVTALKLSA